MISLLAWSTVIGLLLAAALIVLLKSIYSIGPTEVGLVRKRFGPKLPGSDPVAFNGEAGYQAELLMPGLRFKFWLLYAVTKHPWVQVPAGQIGVVISQVGDTLPIGAKSAVYKKDFGNFDNLNVFIAKGGQKGVQRPVLPPGTIAPVHPVAFLVITQPKIFGMPVAVKDMLKDNSGQLTFASFGLVEKDLQVTRIEPIVVEEKDKGGRRIDSIGIVTTREGDPLPAGDIASRLGGFDDIRAHEDQVRSGSFQGQDPSLGGNARLIEVILGSKNEKHNNYQDFQAFLDAGGKIGLQHDPLLYGAYTLNPFLVHVERVPMLVIEQGQVAVIKSYVGLPTVDTSGSEFKFGSLVKPGHRGIWEEPLRTGKYPLNPRIYQAEVVPTSILNLNWSKAISSAHEFDQRLEPIVAKSNEGFVFSIDLQVLIHVPDSKAPRVISMVGSMMNLVNEVLQAAVGNLFRDKLGGMPAIKFIQTRQMVQEEAMQHISEQLLAYEVETKGVYIQDVVLPDGLVKVLTEREIANQEVETFKMQKTAQDTRMDTEKSRGMADMQTELAKAEVQVTIAGHNADARKRQAEGESTYTERTGTAEARVIQAKGTAQATVIEAQGLAKAKGFQAQCDAIGKTSTTLVNVATALAEKGAQFMPQILTLGGGGSLDGLAAALTNFVSNQAGLTKTATPETSTGRNTGHSGAHDPGEHGRA